MARKKEVLLKEVVESFLSCDEIEAANFVNMMGKILHKGIYDALRTGQNFSIPHVGLFKVGKRKGRTGTDPHGKPYLSKDIPSVRLILYGRMKQQLERVTPGTDKREL